MEIDYNVKVRRLTQYDRGLMFTHLREESGLSEKIAEKKMEILKFISDNLVEPIINNPRVYQIWKTSPRLFRQQRSISLNLSELGMMPSNSSYFPSESLGMDILEEVKDSQHYRLVYSRRTVVVPEDYLIPKLSTGSYSDLLIKEDMFKEKGLLMAFQELVLDLFTLNFKYVNFRCHDQSKMADWDWDHGYNFLRGNITTFGQLLSYDEDLFKYLCDKEGIDYEPKPDPEVPKLIKIDSKSIDPKEKLAKNLKDLRKILEAKN